MKKILNWLKSSKSDFILFIVLLILLNIVSSNLFARFDLTGPKSYSLSKGSKTLVKNLEQPLSVRVFFDENLPATYENVAQYVEDILVEYKGAANKNFSVAYMDMSKPENTKLAQELGLQQIQIQEVKNNEVGFKQGYMGLAITYADNIEVLNPITSTDGFEYKLTSKISKMVTMNDALAGLKDDQKIRLTLYLSDDLKKFGISGLDQAQEIVKAAFDKVNEENMDRLEFQVVNPNASEAEVLAAKYGIQAIQYEDENGGMRKGALGLILENGENFYQLPFQIQQSFFGYIVTGLETVDTAITEGLQSLLSNITKIGYITGHGELDKADENGAKNFQTMISGMYELVDIDLNEEAIPAGMNSIIINGPQNDYTEEELYKVDQFIMRGGNVLFFVDGMLMDANAQYTGGQMFNPNVLNISRLLDSYGVKVENNLVFDKKCYVAQDQNFGKVNLYWAPTLQKDQLAKKNPITNNLGYVIMIQNSSIDASKAKEDKDVKVTVLAKTSDEAWTQTENIMLNPMVLTPPSDQSKMQSYDLALMLEGKFKSAFDKAPETSQTDDEGNPLPQGNLETSSHVAASVMPGKIFVIGSSTVTTRQVIDEGATTPIAMFFMNALDYLNGNEDLCVMRSKSLSVNTLEIKSMAAANFWKFFCQYGLVVILIIVGLLVLRSRSRRRRAINKKYNPNDSRTITKSTK
ncbi:MAG: Gldg family protein [Treponema sp.]|nr:Gldg family protein [Treponema sp.]